MRPSDWSLNLGTVGELESVSAAQSPPNSRKCRATKSRFTARVVYADGQFKPEISVYRRHWGAERTLTDIVSLRCTLGAVRWTAPIVPHLRCPSIRQDYLNDVFRVIIDQCISLGCLGDGKAVRDKTGPLHLEPATARSR